MSAAMFTRSMASPTSTSFFRNAAGPKSILKRPAPLPLSPNPFPFAASFSIQVSPGMKSPHVHFPNSAGLIATFSTHSPTTYDRASIAVSPNPLALPAWGDRVYSPASGSFKKSVPPAMASPMLNKPIVSAAAFGSEVVVGAAPKTTKSKARRARFAENVASAQVLPRDASEMTLNSFPRSPYPTAPISPLPVTEARELTPAPRGAEARFKAKRPAALGISGAELSLAQNARSPGRPSFLSPVAESAAPLDSSKLAQDFWRSVSVSEEIAMEVEAATPVSAVPRFVFGTKDGGLWSPGLPNKRTMEESLMSPTTRTNFGPFVESQILSPAPKDAAASYPSFGMVLAGAAESIKYPAPVVTL